MFSVTILTSAETNRAPKTQFAETPKVDTIVIVGRDTWEIRSRCVRKYRAASVWTPETVNVTRTLNARQVTLVAMDVAWIYVTGSRVDLAVHAIRAVVFVRPATSAIPTIM